MTLYQKLISALVPIAMMGCKSYDLEEKPSTIKESEYSFSFPCNEITQGEIKFSEMIGDTKKGEITILHKLRGFVEYDFEVEKERQFLDYARSDYEFPYSYSVTIEYTKSREVVQVTNQYYPVSTFNFEVKADDIDGTLDTLLAPDAQAYKLICDPKENRKMLDNYLAKEHPYLTHPLEKHRPLRGNETGYNGYKGVSSHYELSQ